MLWGVWGSRVRADTLLAFFLMLPKTLFTLSPFMDFMAAASALAPPTAGWARDGRVGGKEGGGGSRRFGDGKR